jgi:hypothetical protein
MTSYALLKMVNVISLAGLTALLAHGRRQMKMHNEDKTGRIYLVTNGHDIQKHGEFPNGTSLQGCVTTTYDTLKRAFGEPSYVAGDKTNVEWVLLIDGVIATVYDWKLNNVPMDEYDWHIGGHSTEAVELVQSVVEQVK